ncbi:MAG: hypothetical protein ACPGXK_13890 [Phycisphaerae bacterium]
MIFIHDGGKMRFNADMVIDSLSEQQKPATAAEYHGLSESGTRHPPQTFIIGIIDESPPRFHPPPSLATPPPDRHAPDAEPGQRRQTPRMPVNFLRNAMLSGKKLDHESDFLDGRPNMTDCVVVANHS